MKKLVLLMFAVLALAGCLAHNVTVNEPYANNLFISKNDLGPMGVGNYGFIDNKSNLEWDQKQYPDKYTNYTFASESVAMPDEKTGYPSVMVEVFKSDVETAKKDFELRRGVNEKLMAIMGQEVKKNFKGLGEENLEYGYLESNKFYVSCWIVRKGEYLLTVQAYEKIQSKADDIAEKTVKVFLSKIEN